MMKLVGYVHCTKISAECKFGFIAAWVRTPKKRGIGLRRWENQRRLSIVITLLVLLSQMLSIVVVYVRLSPDKSSNFSQLLLTVEHTGLQTTVDAYTFVLDFR